MNEPTEEQLRTLPVLLCTNGTKHHQWANAIGGKQCQRPGCCVAIRDGVAVGVGEGSVVQPEPAVEKLDSYSDPASASTINLQFDYHAPDDARRRQHEATREACRAHAHRMDDLVPSGREKSLMRTHLETAMFWANAAIARQE
jgi:hypothetical protein